MRNEKVTITIDDDSIVEAKVEGIAGKSCKDITDALAKDLGTTISSKPTADFYKTEQAKLRQ